MKVISCQLENFASYKTLDFQFDGQGLTLIQGPTGSGKSTLCDAIPWVLFGTTAKGGGVTDVISWPGTDTTCGLLSILHFGSQVSIFRSRGQASKDNDLYFRISDSPPKRGKDLRDTQSLLNEHLGLDSDLYLAGAYYHDFSKLAQFFTTTAKARKELCEQIVDLNLAKNLQLKTSEANKSLAKEFAQIGQDIRTSESQLKLLQRMYIQEEAKRDNWQISQNRKISAFEQTKQAQLMNLQSQIKPASHFASIIKGLENQILKLDGSTCKECGGPKNAELYKDYLQKLNQAKNAAYRNQDLMDQMATLEDTAPPEAKTVNPHVTGVAGLDHEINKELLLNQQLKEQDNTLRTQIEDLEVIQDVIKDFRGEIIKNTLLELETKTNTLLSNYFDAEIKANFLIEDADKIEVTITKDGNLCSYTQLSKGQRCMLKLCFGVATMETVQNHQGVEFNAIFLDESVEGLDEGNKLKALRLFEHLATKYSSVFLVEHSEAIKASIANKFSVELINGQSSIYAS